MSLKIEKLLARGTTPDFCMIITDTVARTNVNAYAIQAISDCVLTGITIGNKATDSNSEAELITSGVTITAGTIILMKISAIQLTSGEAILYQSRSLNSK